MWYIVDGMDGSGKSSIAQYIAGQLESEGRKVLLLTHPNRDSVIGRKESDFLLQDGIYAKSMATFLYILDVIRSLRIKRKVNRSRSYDDVIFVRYIMAVTYVPDPFSKLAYKFFALTLPEPDVKILVDVDSRTAMSRIVSRGEEVESFETEEQLAGIRCRMREHIPDGWDVVDNSGSFEESKTQVLRILKR